MYTEEKFTSLDKNLIIQKKYHSPFCMPENPKTRQRRKPKETITSEQQKKINERLRCEKYTRLLADNFRAGDFYITLTTAEKMTPEEFTAEMRNFMKRFRREVTKRTGANPKYFRALENLAGSGRCHGHLLTSAFCGAAEIRDVMERLWTAGHVQVQIYGGRALDAAHVAGYFTKNDKLERGAKIDTSRGNLIRREPRKKIIHRETFSDKIIPPKGYYVVKELSYNTHSSTGHDYQVAVFEKIREKERGKSHAKTD